MTIQFGAPTQHTAIEAANRVSAAGRDGLCDGESWKLFKAELYSTRSLRADAMIAPIQNVFWSCYEESVRKGNS